jgi:hypothetical protein
LLLPSNLLTIQPLFLPSSLHFLLDYLNYQNMRQTYIDVFLDHLVNWEFVEKQLPADAE